MQGARMMLNAIVDHTKCGNGKFLLVNEGKDSKAYHEAIIKLVMQDFGNIDKFLCGTPRIMFRNHKRNEKGTLVSVEAYFERDI